MLFQLIPAAALSGDPQQVGQVIGGLLVLGLLVMAILKTASLIHRPGASKLCIASLLVLFCGWFISSLSTVLIKLLDLPPWVVVVAGVLGVLIFIASMVLAVAGLVVWGQRKGDYVQGRSQAIWALVLSGIFILAGLGGLVVGLTKNWQDEGAGAPPGAPARFLEMKEYAQFEFGIAHPDRPWVSMPPGKIAPEAIAFYNRARPECYLGIIVEPNPTGMTAKDITSFLVARLGGLAKKVELLPETSVTIAGLNFRRVPVKAEGLSGQKATLYYEYWVACTSRFAYQFTFWSAWRERQTLAAESEAWMKTFKLLKPADEVAEPDVFKDHEAPGEGYGTSGLETAGWRAGQDKSFEEARLVVKHGTDFMALVVLPLPEGNKVRPKDLDDILLGAMNVTEKERPASPAGITHGQIEGREYAFDRLSENVTYRFRARILQHQNMAWMLVTWGLKPDSGEPGLAAAEMVRLFTPEAGAVARELSPSQTKTRAFFYNDLGIAHYKRQEYRDAAGFFQLACQLKPDDLAIAGNWIDAFEEQGKPEEALQILEEEIPGPLRKAITLRARRALLLARTGDQAGADKVWGELFGEGYQNEDHLLAWINLQLDMERPTEALQTMEKYAKEHPSRRIDRWLASVLARNNRYDDAFAVLAKQTSSEPPDAEGLYLQGELENDAGRYEASAKTADRLIAAGEDTARTQLLRGWSEWHRKSWKSAREAFAKAAGKSPEDAAIKQALAMTDGALGQGTAELSRTPLEAVPVPKVMEDALAAAPEPAAALVKGHGAYYRHRVVGVFYQSGKPVRISQYYHVKIMDQSGLEAFSSLSQSFHPSYEKVYVNRLIVKDETGKVIQEGSNADAFSTGESGDLATGTHVLQIPVPGLRRGCTLEAIITVEDKSKSTKPPFRRDLLLGNFPAMARGWFLQGEVAAVRFSPEGGLKALEGPDFRGFVMVNTPAYQRETFMAPLEDWNPLVIAGPAGGDWKGLAADYLKRIKDRLEPDDSTKALAEKLCLGLKTPEEKLGAIVRHVQSNLTYKGLEFGTRGQVPSLVSKIQSDQYGDCKDHTLLLYHLLRRAGIPCSPALVDTAWRLRREIPSLDQFDHMILHVPGTGKQPWIDATEDWLDLLEDVPDFLSGREALVLDSKEAHFEKILPPAATAIKIDRKVRVEAGGKLAVDETLTLTGAAASWARIWLLGSPESEYVNLVRRQLNAYGLFDLSRVELTHAEEVTRPVVIRMSYSVADAVTPETRQVTLPFFWERDYLSVSPSENRRSPFRLSPAMGVESTTRIAGGWAPGTPPAPAEDLPASGKLTEGQWELAAVPEGNDWVIRLKVDCRQGDFPVTGWTGFQQGRRALLERLKRPVATIH